MELDTVTPFGQRRAALYERLIWQLCDWRALPQKLRQRLRKRFARKVTGPFDQTHRGMKFRLYPAENYCDRVLFGRNVLPELAEHEALAPLVRPGMTFVDIGANVGSYCLFVGNLTKGDLNLVAFEPHPRTFQKLIFNLKTNDLPLDHVWNGGVGPERETLSLWSDGGSNIGHTSMLKEGTANAKVSVDVPVVPLLDHLTERQIETIDLLKIDVEGFEERALGPFFDQASPSLYPKHILIEIAHQHLWQKDLLGELQAIGYATIFSTPENLLLSLMPKHG